MVKKPKNSSGFWYNIKYNYLTIINNNKYVLKVSLVNILLIKLH